jgi:hypothetical protein
LLVFEFGCVQVLTHVVIPLRRISMYGYGGNIGMDDSQRTLEDVEYALLTQAIRMRYGYDFSQYSVASLRRWSGPLNLVQKYVSI